MATELISGLGVIDTFTKPLKIYCDNSAAVFFSKNDKYSRGAKHMELKYFPLRMRFRNIEYVLNILEQIS